MSTQYAPINFQSLQYALHASRLTSLIWDKQIMRRYLLYCEMLLVIGTYSRCAAYILRVKLDFSFPSSAKSNLPNKPYWASKHHGSNCQRIVGRSACVCYHPIERRVGTEATQVVLLSMGYFGQAEGREMVHVQVRCIFAHFCLSGSVKYRETQEYIWFLIGYFIK